MGLIDFVKDAGQELLKRAGVVDEVEPDALVKAIHDHGLAIDGLSVAVDGDRATVRGTAASQAEREKAVLIVGNTQGVARVDDQLAVKAPEPEATYYTVVKGDTLSKIAKAQYGDPMKYPALFEANRPMLKDADLIYPGQVLRIPPAAQV